MDWSGLLLGRDAHKRVPVGRRGALDPTLTLLRLCGWRLAAKLAREVVLA